MKSYKKPHKVPKFAFTLYINGIDIMSNICTNRHFRECLYNTTIGK